MSFLYELESPLIICAFSAALLVLLMVLTGLFRRLPALRPTADRAEAAANVQIPLFLSCSLILSFALADGHTAMRQAEDVVSQEASRLSVIDRTLLRIDSPASLAVRPLLKDYVRCIVEDEWPSMSKGEPSPKTDHALKTFADALTDVLVSDSQNVKARAAQLQRLLDEVIDLRDKRLALANKTLYSGYWVAIGTLVLMLLVVIALQQVSNFVAGLNSLLIIALGVLVGLLFIIDRPYLGQHSVDSDALVRLLNG